MTKKIVMIIFCIGLFVIGNSMIGTVSAADQDLAEQYAPILYFESQEKCYPTDVSYALENSNLYKIGDPTPVLTLPISASALLNATTADSTGYYLDNQRGTISENDDGIENDYQNKMTTLGYTVYAHVDSVDNVIQYWFFYAFNGGDLNRHEGDWEMIQIALSGGEPSQVMFSQHHSGQTALWRQVDYEGTHVKVYVARGSHANYIKPYSGKIGLASDTVGDNGKVIQPVDYTIELLGTQPWLDYAGLWGWAGENQSAASEAMILGQAGPNGPKYREDSLMWQPMNWAGDLQPANDYLFIAEWFVYNFVLIFFLFTALSLLLLAFFIYRRNKKHGLGPRIFSLLYIDGSNTKSIGNILCFVAIILAVIGLMSPWYTMNANVSIPSYTETGTFTALSVDGLNGIQIQLPNQDGPMPLGTFALPFYLLIGIGLVFLILATIGVPQSKKLGKKYLLRGIRLLIPFILILVFIIAIASIIPLFAPASVQGNADLQSAMDAVSASPFSGQYSMQIAGDQTAGSVQLEWGFGLGAYLLLFAGIILIVAGFIEITTQVQFFEEKIQTGIEPPKQKKIKKK